MQIIFFIENIDKHCLMILNLKVSIFLMMLFFSSEEIFHFLLIFINIQPDSFCYALHIIRGRTQLKEILYTVRTVGHVGICRSAKRRSIAGSMRIL